MKIKLPLLMLPLCLATACITPADADSTASATDDLVETDGLAGTNGVNGFGHISLSNTNWCVEPTGGFDGARLVLHACSSSLAQNWLFTLFPGTSDYRIVNQASGLCIYNDSFPTQNHGSVISGGCTVTGTGTPVSNARWRPSHTSGPASLQSEIRATPGFCIDVPNGVPTDGVTLQMYQCNGTPAQVFIIQ